MCQLSYSIIASILLAVVEYLFVFFYGQFRGYLSPRLSHVGVNLVEKHQKKEVVRETHSITHKHTQNIEKQLQMM